MTIGSIEKYINDTAWERAGSSRASLRERAVGRHHRRRPRRPGGGRAAAPRATRSTVYDRYDRIGGLMIYGIPGFKLEKYVVDRRVKLLAEGA